MHFFFGAITSSSSLARSTFKVYIFGKDNLIRILRLSSYCSMLSENNIVRSCNIANFSLGVGWKRPCGGAKKFSGGAQPLVPSPPRKSIHSYSTHVYIHTKYLPILKQLHVSWRLNLRSLFKSHLSKSFRMQCS